MWVRQKGSFDRTYEGLKRCLAGHELHNLAQLLTVPMRV